MVKTDFATYADEYPYRYYTLFNVDSLKSGVTSSLNVVFSKSDVYNVVNGDYVEYNKPYVQAVYNVSATQYNGTNDLTLTGVSSRPSLYSGIGSVKNYNPRMCCKSPLAVR